MLPNLKKYIEKKILTSFKSNTDVGDDVFKNNNVFQNIECFILQVRFGNNQNVGY